MTTLGFTRPSIAGALLALQVGCGGAQAPQATAPQAVTRSPATSAETSAPSAPSAAAVAEAPPPANAPSARQRVTAGGSCGNVRSASVVCLYCKLQVSRRAAAPARRRKPRAPRPIGQQLRPHARHLAARFAHRGHVQRAMRKRPHQGLRMHVSLPAVSASASSPSN
jgi:hypothetical protein